MLYSKPKNVSYTDMAIFFDKNFWSASRDDNTCFKYMYLLAYMLARKKEYFRTFDDYDMFARYVCSTIYSRFLKKQHEGEQIRSILNYLKRTLNFLRIDFQAEHYREVVTEGLVKGFSSSDMILNAYNNIQANYFDSQSDMIKDDVLDVFKQIPAYIVEEIANSPYRNSPVEARRIYLSCLISLIKSFTLSEASKNNIKRRMELNIKIDRQFMKKVFNKERNTSVTLWKLDSSMYNYIAFLTNKIRKRLSEELSIVINSYVLSTETLEAILNSAWDGASNREYGDEEY